VAPRTRQVVHSGRTAAATRAVRAWPTPASKSNAWVKERAAPAPTRRTTRLALTTSFARSGNDRSVAIRTGRQVSPRASTDRIPPALVIHGSERGAPARTRWSGGAASVTGDCACRLAAQWRVRDDSAAPANRCMLSSQAAMTKLRWRAMTIGSAADRLRCSPSPSHHHMPPDANMARRWSRLFQKQARQRDKTRHRRQSNRYVTVLPRRRRCMHRARPHNRLASSRAQQTLCLGREPAVDRVASRSASRHGRPHVSVCVRVAARPTGRAPANRAPLP